MLLDERKRVLVVGGGKWGKNLIRNFQQLCVLHSICDIDQNALREYATLYPDVMLFSDYQEALKIPKIDKVVIATPAAHHYAMVKEALCVGKDVFVEKPLCLKSSEGKELVALANSQKRILMVGHLLQYHPCIMKLQEIVARGVLGKLLYIESNRLNLGVVRNEENALWSLAPHDFSIILSLANGELPLSVRCVGKAHINPQIVDMAITTMRFAHDLHAHVFSSWLHPFKEQKLVLVGSQGMAVFDDTKAWDKKLALHKTLLENKIGKAPLIMHEDSQFVAVSESEPLRCECEQFLLSCQTRIPPKTDANEGLKVLLLLQAAQESLDAEGESKTAQPYFSHLTAHVDPTAIVLEGTHIWNYSKIMENARVGYRCNIGQNVVISPDVVLGNNVKVQNNVSLYTGVICEDDVFLGPSMVFTNVINPRSAVNRKDAYQKTVVRRGCTIGANATILCGIELGTYCFIGAGAVVTKDVKPFALMVGNPAKQIGWMSRNGQRLNLPLESSKELVAACSESGELYSLNGNILYLKASS